MIKKHLVRIGVIVPILTLCILISLSVLKVADALDLHIYIGWKKVKIENVCEMKVPITWRMEKKNGLVYFYDTISNNICLIQSKYYTDGEPEIDLEKAKDLETEKTETNILGNDFQCKTRNYGGVNSLGVFLGDAIVSVDNKLYEVNYIEAFNYEDTKDVLFYSWNNTPYKIIDKVSDSIIMEE